MEVVSTTPGGRICWTSHCVWVQGMPGTWRTMGVAQISSTTRRSIQVLPIQLICIWAEEDWLKEVGGGLPPDSSTPAFSRPQILPRTTSKAKRPWRSHQGSRKKRNNYDRTKLTPVCFLPPPQSIQLSRGYNLPKPKAWLLVYADFKKNRVVHQEGTQGQGNLCRPHTHQHHLGPLLYAQGLKALVILLQLGLQHQFLHLWIDSRSEFFSENYSHLWHVFFKISNCFAQDEHSWSPSHRHSFERQKISNF